MKETPRYERKLYFPDCLPEELEKFIKTNPYGFTERYEERIVNSIYYETESLDSYFDNENGHGNRAKFRTRWYGKESLPNSNAVHELKVKNSLTGFKIRENIGSTSEYMEHLIKITKPILKVRYLRKYFESFDEKIRVTIDREITYQGLQNYASRKDPVAENGCVIEVKYDPKDDDLVSKILSGLNHRVEKFSKFARGIKSCYS